jgi:hypothetical protein
MGDSAPGTNMDMFKSLGEANDPGDPTIRGVSVAREGARTNRCGPLLRQVVD